MNTETSNNPKSQHQFVLPETILMAVIGGADLLYTVYLLGQSKAMEANPIFGPLLKNYGPNVFVLAKFVALAGPLALAEFARRRNEPFVRMALRIGIALYVAIYGLAYLRYNR